MKILKRILLGCLFLILSACVFYGIMIVFHKAPNPLRRTLTPTDAPSPTELATNKKEESTNSTTLPTLIPNTDKASGVELTDFDLSQLVEQALPSIIAVNATKETMNAWTGAMVKSQSAGTGFCIKEDSDHFYFATNSHVVYESIDVRIILSNSTDDLEHAISYPVTLKGYDTVGDLAILTLKKTDLNENDHSYLRVATLADSGLVKSGNVSVAIGNALGVGLSATVGHISAVEREVKTGNGYSQKLIQTDTPINPGNSGGPLLNNKGEVIGITSSKYSDTTIEGMGFAIPITKALPLLNELENLEDIPTEEQGYLGVYIEEITAALSEAFDMPRGIRITKLMPGSSAERAGLEVSDIITHVNGIEILTTAQLQNRVTSYRIGTEIIITVQRLNKEGTYTSVDIPVILMSKNDMVE